MTATPPSAPGTPAMTSYEGLVAFLRAHGATDYPGHYRINAAGVCNAATNAFHPCDTTPLYTQLGVPFGADITIGATTITVTQQILLYRPLA